MELIRLLWELTKNMCGLLGSLFFMYFLILSLLNSPSWAFDQMVKRPWRVRHVKRIIERKRK